MDQWPAHAHAVVVHPQHGILAPAVGDGRTAVLANALDADSEGVEGKFYTWTHTELKEVLGSNTQIIEDYYTTTHEGNWEHGRNILHRKIDLIPADIIKDLKAKLLTARTPRIRR